MWNYTITLSSVKLLFNSQLQQLNKLVIGLFDKINDKIIAYCQYQLSKRRSPCLLLVLQ